MPPSWVLSPGHSASLSLVCLHLLQLSSVAILRCVHECIDLAICPSFCLRLWCHAAAGTVSERVYSGLPNMSQGQCLLGCPPLPGSYRAGHAASPHPAPDGLPAPLTRSGHVVRVANMRSVYWMHLSIGQDRQVDCKNHSSECTIHLSEIYKANATYVKIRNTQSSVWQVLQLFHLSDCHFYSSQTIGRVKFRTLTYMMRFSHCWIVKFSLISLEKLPLLRGKFNWPGPAQVFTSWGHLDEHQFWKTVKHCSALLCMICYHKWWHLVRVVLSACR